MGTTPNQTALLAQQFQVEQLEPRLDLWSKDLEQANPSVPSPGCPDCPCGN